MCLLEWCRREKLPQPVYETVSSWLRPPLHLALQHSHIGGHHPQYTYSLYPGLQAAWLEPGFALCRQRVVPGGWASC